MSFNLYLRQIDFYFDPYVSYWITKPGANGRTGIIPGFLLAVVLPCMFALILNAHIINIIRQLVVVTIYVGFL